MNAWPIIATCLIACASTPTPRGDWCGTDRAEIRYAGELASNCADGDFFACQISVHECAAGRQFHCTGEPAPSGSEALLAECVAREARDGELCASADYPALHPERYASRCNRHEFGDCYKLGLVREHAGNVEAAAKLYAMACDHGVQAACARAGKRASDATLGAQATGDYGEMVRLFRLGCFKLNNPEACAALERFRAEARSEAEACETGNRARCERAAAMIRAASQGPKDDARAESLARRGGIGQNESLSRPSN